MAAVRALLVDGATLVTIAGPGGVGKTRLAIAVAASIAGTTAQDVVFVPLADIRDASLVVPAIGRAAGVHGDGTLERVTVALQHRAILLVLDNLEQVLDVAPQLARVLDACPQVTFLVTSRAPLGISGERVHPLAPLGLPEIGADPEDLGTLASVEAITLFMARARGVDPSFALTPDNAPDVAAICTRLDGLPLAIELAASRIPVLSSQAILARLDRRFALLTTGAVDQPARLRSL